MVLAGVKPEPEVLTDPAYPMTTAPDPVYPCQTLEVLPAPLNGVAVPAMWSRIHGPIDRALAELWNRLGLMSHARPERWTTLHYGRIAINAHGWERLCARFAGTEPDPALLEPPARGLRSVPERLEKLRVAVSRGKLARRIREAEVSGERALSRASVRDPSELEIAELARGPLDDLTWTDLLLPALGLALSGEPSEGGDPALGAAVGLEQRHGAELGRRLEARGALLRPSDVAYLTVSERIQAVHEDSDYWPKLIAFRQERVDSYVELALPPRFWGRPRVEPVKTS